MRNTDPMTAAIALSKEALAELFNLSFKRMKYPSGHAGACSFYHTLCTFEKGDALIGLDGLDGASWRAR